MSVIKPGIKCFFLYVKADDDGCGMLLLLLCARFYYILVLLCIYREPLPIVACGVRELALALAVPPPRSS